MTTLTNRAIVEAEAAARKRIPAHLDADELVANAWLNAADVPAAEQVDVFAATVAMYVDQDCSTF